MMRPLPARSALAALFALAGLLLFPRVGAADASCVSVHDVRFLVGLEWPVLEASLDAGLPAATARTWLESWRTVVPEETAHACGNRRERTVDLAEVVAWARMQTKDLDPTAAILPAPPGALVVTGRPEVRRHVSELLRRLRRAIWSVHRVEVVVASCPRGTLPFDPTPILEDRTGKPTPGVGRLDGKQAAALVEDVSLRVRGRDRAQFVASLAWGEQGLCEWMKETTYLRDLRLIPSTDPAVAEPVTGVQEEGIRLRLCVRRGESASVMVEAGLGTSEVLRWEEPETAWGPIEMPETSSVERTVSVPLGHGEALVFFDQPDAWSRFSGKRRQRRGQGDDDRRMLVLVRYLGGTDGPGDAVADGEELASVRASTESEGGEAMALELHEVSDLVGAERGPHDRAGTGSDAERLAGLVRACIAQNSGAMPEPMVECILPGTLGVTASPGVHRRVRELLMGLRRQQFPMMGAETRLLTARAGEATPAAGGLLAALARDGHVGDHAATSLQSGPFAEEATLRPLCAPRVVSIAGQRSEVSVLEQTAYVGGATIRAEKGATVAEPSIMTQEEGVRLELRAWPGSIGGSSWVRGRVVLHGAPDDSLRRRTVELRPGTGGESVEITLELPISLRTSMRFTDLLPVDQWALLRIPGVPAGALAGAQEDGAGMGDGLALLRVGHVDLTEPAADPPDAESDSTPGPIRFDETSLPGSGERRRGR